MCPHIRYPEAAGHMKTIMHGSRSVGLAHMDPHVQGYVKRLSKILLVTGQDTDGPLGAQLGQLEHELCCLHAVKTRVAPRDWSRFFYYKGPQDHSLEGWDGLLSEADCFALLVSLTASLCTVGCAAERD